MQKFTDSQLAEALHLSGGDITAAAASLHCERQTIYNRISKNVKLQQVLDDEREAALDLAESELMKLVKAGEFPAIKFFLSTKGRNRGSTEKQEVSLDTGFSVLIEGKYAELG